MTLYDVVGGNRLPIVQDSFKGTRDCGFDNICEPNLRVSARTDSTYVLGSADLLEIQVFVENYGEEAHEATFFMTIALGVSLHHVERSGHNVSTSMSCATQFESPHDDIKCDLGNPMLFGEAVNFKVFLSPSPVEGMPDIFTFDMEVNSRNPESDLMNNDNYFTAEIPIRIVANLSVKGEAIDKPIQYSSSDYLSLHYATIDSEIGPQVVNIHEIRNEGNTSVKEAEVIFSWPRKTFEGDSLLYLVLQPKTSNNMHCEPPYFDNEEHVHVNRTLIPQNFLGRNNKFKNREKEIKQRHGQRITCERRHAIDVYMPNHLYLSFGQSESSIIRCKVTELEPNSSAWIAADLVR